MMLLVLIIVLYAISMITAVFSSRVYIISECAYLRILNPTTKSTLPAVLDTWGEIIYVALGAPIVEEFIFRYLPTVIYYITGCIIPLILMNIMWVIAHYGTIKSLYSNEPMALVFGHYIISAFIYSIPCILLFKISIVLSYIVPVAMHMINNIIALIVEKLRRSNITVRSNRYWTLRL